MSAYKWLMLPMVGSLVWLGTGCTVRHVDVHTYQPQRRVVVHREVYHPAAVRREVVVVHNPRPVRAIRTAPPPPRHVRVERHVRPPVRMHREVHVRRRHPR